MLGSFRKNSSFLNLNTLIGLLHLDFKKMLIQKKSRPLINKFVLYLKECVMYLYHMMMTKCLPGHY